MPPRDLIPQSGLNPQFRPGYHAIDDVPIGSIVGFSVALVAFAALSAGVMYTHYMGAFFLLSQVVAVLILRRARKGFLFEFLLASAGAFILFLPWMPVFLTHVRDVSSAGFWIPKPTREGVAAALYELVGQAFFLAPRHHAIVCVPFYVAAAIPLVRKPQREDAAMALAFLTPIAGEIATSLLSTTSVFYTRTFLYVLIPLFVMATVGVFRLPERLHAAGCAALAGLLASNLIFTRAVPEKEAWRDVAEILRRGVGQDDLVIAAPGYTAVNLEYYASRAGETAWLARLRRIDHGTLEHPAVPMERVIRELDGPPAVWLVTRHGNDRGWPAVLEPSFEFRCGWKQRGAEVRLYRRR